MKNNGNKQFYREGAEFDIQCVIPSEYQVKYIDDWVLLDPYDQLVCRKVNEKIEFFNKEKSIPVEALNGFSWAILNNIVPVHQDWFNIEHD